MIKMKEREVWCKICKYSKLTSEIGPKCDRCQSYLITVVRSLLTGQKLTADNELVNGTNESA